MQHSEYSAVIFTELEQQPLHTAPQEVFGRSAFLARHTLPVVGNALKSSAGPSQRFAATSTWPRVRTIAASDEQRSAPTCPDLLHCLWLFRLKHMKFVYASQGGRIRRLDSPEGLLSVTKRECSVVSCALEGMAFLGMSPGMNHGICTEFQVLVYLSHMTKSTPKLSLLQVTLPKNLQEWRADGTLGIKSRKLASAS